jgi:hypothetical protein
MFAFKKKHTSEHPPPDRVTERVRSPCVSHLLGFWVPVEIRGRYLVRWKALVKAYMPTYIFVGFFFKEVNVV